MELSINNENQPSMFLTNVDNEGVYVNDERTFMELVSIAGIEKVEIFYPRAGWRYLQEEIENWSQEEFSEDGENEQELLEAWWEYFQGCAYNYRVAKKYENEDEDEAE